MLFGGTKPAPRRKPAGEAKPVEQGKPAEQPKPTDPKTQPPINVPIVVPSNQQKPTLPVNPPSDAGKNKTVSNTGDVNKSTDSGKNNYQSQGGKETTVIISGGAKVVVNPAVNPGGLNNKK
jgi:hypothetical protein